ncbi:glutamate receptor ionotropic, NMDA 2D-like protein [Anopheles sinensis]|uniref:Glutamate receptor ionotropic, NMDA 2D-like protein n=1 Tax=Anopheles sinensis TaxID=74873 RepID=A0A084W4X4_ANOSI|nr:glutamate receptor ionotropic, NMDA 2D-like protein [Anopheles sinensis]
MAGQDEGKLAGPALIPGLKRESKCDGHHHIIKHYAPICKTPNLRKCPFATVFGVTGRFSGGKNENPPPVGLPA